MIPISRTLCIGILLSSCAMTTVSGIWRSSSFAGPPFRRVLICARSHDDATGRLLVDAFVRELQANGVTGAPCPAVLSTGKSTAQQLKAAASGVADGIIFARVASLKQTPIYDDTPGAGWSSADGSHEAQIETDVRLQANAYSVGQGGKLIWSGTSETFDPASAGGFVSQVVPRFINAMASGGVLPPRAHQGHSP